MVAIAESYSNLVTFGLHHGMTAWHGAIAPLAVDAFIVMGEVMLFAALLMHLRGKGLYAYAVFLALGGFAMSVGGNIFRSVPLPVWTDRAVQAVWPVTATAALTGCLIIIKRIMASRGAGETAVPATAAVKPSPAPASRTREPSRPVPVRAARTPGLVTASDHEAQVVLKLVTAGHPFPSIRKLAAAEFGGKIRPSQRCLKLAAAQMNGGGGDDHSESS